MAAELFDSNASSHLLESSPLNELIAAETYATSLLMQHTSWCVTGPQKILGELRTRLLLAQDSSPQSENSFHVAPPVGLFGG